MHLLALQTGTSAGGQLEQVASTFGVDWTHLLAQSVSFGIVCLVLWMLAYKPILKILSARREQIAAGLANAQKIKAELARIDAERHAVLAVAGEEGRKLIQDARAAAARVEAAETRKAIAGAELILSRAHEASQRDHARMLEELKHELGRLVVQTTGSVTGKILTADDHQRLAEETANRLAIM
jgi:F-type H+-transporting ATPase subunit b